MKKYSVKFYDIVYMEKEFVITAPDAATAFQKANAKHESGAADESWETVGFKTWRKPSVSRIYDKKDN